MHGESRLPGQRTVRKRSIRALIAAVLICAGVACAAAPSASADLPDYTWSGQGAAGLGTDSGGWSAVDNWESGTPPQANSTVGTLSFPTLTYYCPTELFECPYDRYESTNDLTGLTATALVISLDAGIYGYQFEGNGLALGSGGLTASGAVVSTGPTPMSTFAQFELPLTLAAAQTWSITGLGGSSTYTAAGVSTDGLSGDYPLSVDLSADGGVSFGQSQTEVGPVSIVGSNSSDAGFAAGANGQISLEDPTGTLNATDGNTVALMDAGMILGNANGVAVGPLMSHGGLIDVQQGALTVDGSMALDQATALELAVGDAGSSPGFDYSQINAAGDVTLGNAEIQFAEGVGESQCFSLVPGAQYELITASGAISGELSDASGNPIPNGAAVTLPCEGTSDQQPTVTFSYGTHAVTATVAYPGPPAPSAPPTQILTVPPAPGATAPPIAPIPTSAAPSVSGIASTGRWSVRHDSADATASCVGSTGATCHIATTLSATRVTTKHGRGTTSQSVLVGRTSVVLNAGETETITVRLSSAGTTLLKHRRALVVKLVAKSGTSVLSHTSLTFEEPEKHRP
jgi:hypothetical protein